MELFKTALKAKIPIIGVHTDDVLNSSDVISTYLGKPTQPLPQGRTPTFTKSTVYVSYDPETVITTALYHLLEDNDSQLVWVNFKPNSLVFNAGILPTPDIFLSTYLKEFTQPMAIPALLQVLVGLSLKSVKEIVQLTMARTGGLLPSEVRHTRMLLGGQTVGLQSLSSTFDFYLMPSKLGAWLEINRPYFLNPNTKSALIPRGLMLKGIPGVGKTMASKVVASKFDVPLFRFDIGASLSRWLGQSERQVLDILTQVEKNAPCILLIDEVEKLFGENMDAGTTQRILSQLLWWLAEHRARVLTIMTTNDVTKIPPELYRQGRVDEVFDLPPLTPSGAKEFAASVYESIVGVAPAQAHREIMDYSLYEQDKFSAYGRAHSAVTQLVTSLIKIHGWVPNLEVDKLNA